MKTKTNIKAGTLPCNGGLIPSVGDSGGPMNLSKL